MATLFRVKALFEYSSVHEDDLSFDAGQIITVTEQEDEDWYGGEYVDGNGVKREGIFPRNFVEKFEPTAPPRPSRARPKPSISEGQASEETVAQPPPPAPSVRHDEIAAPTLPAQPVTEAEPPVPAPATAPAPAAAPPVPVPVPAPAAPTTSSKPPPPLAKPKPAPPPVAEKPTSFKDRIAAFNKPSASPIAPVKPGSFGGGGGNAGAFIKKQFVAPPPIRNAYVPTPREVPVAKVYHREEDPEIREQVAENLGQAERAGLVPHESQNDDEEEDQPKPTSLKERIALLQRQQLEQAQRQADVLLKKEKPKRPPKKPTDGASIEEGDESHSSSSQTLDRRDSEDSRPIASTENHRPAPPPPRKLSEGNNGDVAGVGEATEGQEGLTERNGEGDQASQHPVPTRIMSSASAGIEGGREEEENAEEEAEDDVDPEVRRKEELRARMAKMSRGMGFAGMFGGPMPPFGAPATKKKGPQAPAKPSAVEEEANVSLPRAPPVPVMMALPGMSLPAKPEVPRRVSEEQPEPVPRAAPAPPPAPPSAPAPPSVLDHKSPEQEVEATPLAAVAQPPPQLPPPAPQAPEVSEEPLSPTSAVELQPPPPAPSRPPAPAGGRPSPPPPPTSPPAPSTVRPPPPPPPALSTITSATEGSESDDELSNAARENPSQDTPPPPGVRSPLIPQEPMQNFPSRSPPLSPRPETFSPKSPIGSVRRYSRLPPPVPGAAPTLPPGVQARPPPPPVAPMRQPSLDLSSPLSTWHPAAGDGIEEVTEYDGDCDTDIASSVHHKGALRSRNRAPSFDDTSMLSPSLMSPASEAPSTSLPPAPASTLRAVPPPIPRHSSPELMRNSSDSPSVAPPPLPAIASSKAMSPSSNEKDFDQGYVPAAGVLSSSYSPQPGVEDELQDSVFFPGVPRARSPPERKFPQAGVASRSSNRLSVDRANMNARRSVDHHRPSMDSGFIASDVDLAPQSGWWRQVNQVPPALQGRRDIYFEYDESTMTTPEGKTIVTRETSVLYQDYSQTVFTARYDSSDPATVELDQRHEPPPVNLRQDQMEEFYDRFGRRIAQAALTKKDTIVGDGTPQSFILELIRPLGGALRPVSTRSFGALVYSNMANASTQQHDVIRAGDILTIRNAKFQGKHGPMHAKYSMDVGKPDHVAVVAEWDGTKKKVRAWEQGRESKKVRQESYKLDDLRSGEVKIWRVVHREWVGWHKKRPDEEE